MNKSLPNFAFRDLLEQYGSPLYVYDEQGIRERARELKKAFSWARNYKNYFAVKACPTPAILKLLHEEGMGFDCSSRAELEMMKRLKIPSEDIFFTSNNTSKEDFELAIEIGAIVNIDDVTQVSVFLEVLGKRRYGAVSVRFNPGNEHSGNGIIGEPEQAKYGMSLVQIITSIKQLRNADIAKVGLHTMVASNELEAKYFAKTAQIIKNAVKFIEVKTSNGVDFVNLGGGFGVAYSPENTQLDIEHVGQLVKEEIKDLDIPVYTENGRIVTGPYGYLVTKVRYVMEKYKNYIGVDASMQNLMRPGMYGAYHHITVLGKGSSGDKIYDVVGSLCENNDKFAIDRELPDVEPGDIMIIHDVGAHGHAMGFNYNGLLRSAEVLVHPDGSTELIRRAETLDDYFSCIVW